MRVREASADERPVVRNIIDGAMLEADDVSERIVAGDVLVAVDGNRVLGALVLDPEIGDAPQITAIAVRRRRRGQGIGTALVEAALERSGRLTAEFDPGVEPFYDALGFEIEPIDGERLRGTSPRSCSGR